MNRAQLAALILCGAQEESGKLEELPGDPRASIAGRSMAGWVVEACVGASIRRIGLVGAAPAIRGRAEFSGRADGVDLAFAGGPGTDAVESVALGLERLDHDLTLNESAHIVVVPMELPQVRASQLRTLVETHVRSGAAATAVLGPPALEEGPLVTRSADGSVEHIVDPLPEGHGEVSFACVRASLLLPALRRCTPPGWRNGVLLSDALATLQRAGYRVDNVSLPVPLHRIVDSRSRVPVERELRDRIVGHWIDRGVAISDPRSVSIDATVELGHGVRLHPGTVLEGNTTVGDMSSIGPNTHLVNAVVGTDVQAPSVAIYDSEIEPHARLQPFTVHGSPRR